jgi:hypothetical protein
VSGDALEFGAGDLTLDAAGAWPDLRTRLSSSSHTVKTEVKAIYRKLGVSSRNDAVQRATAIGLLGG